MAIVRQTDFRTKLRQADPSAAKRETGRNSRPPFLRGLGARFGIQRPQRRGRLWALSSWLLLICAIVVALWSNGARNMSSTPMRLITEFSSRSRISIQSIAQSSRPSIAMFKLLDKNSWHVVNASCAAKSDLTTLPQTSAVSPIRAATLAGAFEINLANNLEDAPRWPPTMQ